MHFIFKIYSNKLCHLFLLLVLFLTLPKKETGGKIEMGQLKVLVVHR